MAFLIFVDLFCFPSICKKSAMSLDLIGRQDHSSLPFNKQSLSQPKWVSKVSSSSYNWCILCILAYSYVFCVFLCIQRILYLTRPLSEPEVSNWSYNLENFPVWSQLRSAWASDGQNIKWQKQVWETDKLFVLTDQQKTGYGCSSTVPGQP